MHSMTGYGRMSVERDGRQLTLEMKSVNNRFLDLSFRMPRSLNFAEDAARKQISSVLARGHVDVFATYRNLREDSKQVLVDEALLSAYMRAMDQIAGKTALKDDRTVSGMARMSDERLTRCSGCAWPRASGSARTSSAGWICWRR